MQKTGIVMALDGREAVVLTADGEFCRVTAPPSVQIGAELVWTIADITPMIPVHPRPWRRSRWTVGASMGVAAALAIAAGFWSMHVQQRANHQPYAYVALDIRPGVTLTVDRNMNVVQTVAFNREGQHLLKSTPNVTNVSLQKAVDNLVSTAANANMIPSNDNILVAASSVTSAPVSAATKVQQVAQSAVETALQANQKAKQADAHVYTYEVSPTVWNVAQKLKVSPAKVAAYLQQMSIGRNIPLTQLHKAPLTVNASTLPLELTALQVDTNDSQAVESEILQAIAHAGGTDTGTVSPTVAPSVAADGSPTGSRTATGPTLPSAIV